MIDQLWRDTGVLVGVRGPGLFAAPPKKIVHQPPLLPTGIQLLEERGAVPVNATHITPAVQALLLIGGNTGGPKQQGESVQQGSR